MKSGRLSPLASPFFPAYEPVNLVVYNNGIPSMTFSSEAEALRGIPDSAIDESFPLNAQDAYELEAAEHYCAMLADLSIMEQREERARNFAYSPVRWEARRRIGLKGRPHPPSNNIIPAPRGRAVGTSRVQSLVVSSRNLRHNHGRGFIRPPSQLGKRPSHRSKVRSAITTIQQPRKQS